MCLMALVTKSSILPPLHEVFMCISFNLMWKSSLMNGSFSVIIQEYGQCAAYVYLHIQFTTVRSNVGLCSVTSYL